MDKSYIITYGSLLQLLLEHGDLVNIDISQGSVAKHLRCGGIFEYQFVANLRLGLPANFENWLTLGEVMCKSSMSCFFDSRCISFKIVRYYLLSVTIFISKVPSFYASNSSFFHRVLDLMTASMTF